MAPPGELADEPDDVKIFEVDDGGDPVGLLIKWDSAEWLWADHGDYEPLDP